MAAALRNLLEVYGALDEAVAQSDDPSIAKSLDAFLPKASANPGWYRELERYFFGNNARREPKLEEALTKIAEDNRQGNRLSAPQKSRLLYGVCTATRIKEAAPECTLPTLTDEQLANALVAVGPEPADDTDYESRVSAVSDSLDEYWTQLQGFATRNDFRLVRRNMANANIVDEATLKIPLCQAAIVTVDGTKSVVIDTEISSDAVTLNNLIRIVNPFNWDENYPDFFIDMARCPGAERRDRWRRVLEKVGFRGLDGRELTTALKYYPSIDDDGVAHIDYDLDDPFPGPGGDGQVEVDRGFINMRATNSDRDPQQAGVKVRTRKVVRIKDLSPYAQQRLVCITGYGTASSEFLLGPAADPLSTAKAFEFYDTEEQPPPSDESETVPSRPAGHVVTTAVTMWTESVQGLTSDSFELAEKWLSGELTLSDVADFSTQAAGRLIRAPLAFLEAASQPRYPGGGSNNTVQGGGA
jgi:hypothetical protein